jgi:hypothetical protein
MSLTSHLDDKTSPIGQFLSTRFAQTPAITRVANPQLRTLTPLCPQPLPSEKYPYREIGRAIDYRIRYSFAITPWEDFVAAKGARHLLAHADNADYASSLISGFAEHLAAMLADIRPVGRTLTSDEEVRMARYCYILNLFEHVFRTGDVPEALYAAVCSHPDKVVKGRRKKQAVETASDTEIEACVSQLLASVAEHWADDLAALGMLAVDRLGLLLSQPVDLNPTFAGSIDVGGADADLIVNGCLLDVKATKNPAIEAVWLRQLAGYVLLDYEDEHHIDSVGIYMVRQGALLCWPLDEFVHTLTGDSSVSVADLRRELRTLVPDLSTLVPQVSHEDTRVRQASDDEMCVNCGTQLVCTYDANVELDWSELRVPLQSRRKGPQTDPADHITVRCPTCDVQISCWHESPSQSSTGTKATRRRAEAIYDFNQDMANKSRRAR